MFDPEVLVLTLSLVNGTILFLISISLIFICRKTCKPRRRSAAETLALESLWTFKEERRDGDAKRLLRLQLRKASDSTVRLEEEEIDNASVGGDSYNAIVSEDTV